MMTLIWKNLMASKISKKGFAPETFLKTRNNSNTKKFTMGKNFFAQTHKTNKKIRFSYNEIQINLINKNVTKTYRYYNILFFLLCIYFDCKFDIGYILFEL